MEARQVDDNLVKQVELNKAMVRNLPNFVSPSYSSDESKEKKDKESDYLPGTRRKK
jgi:hypothetical protein